MRIAWFSPLPPLRSGIAAYSAELLPRLARHEIEAFVDDGDGSVTVARTPAIPGVTIRGAHDFPWRHARRPYDVVVYHLGNDLCHDYMWPYLVRHPGLVVLHDAQLLQARARGLIRQGRQDDFGAELAYSYPDAPPGLADFIIAGLGGTLCYFWPMVQVPVESARVVAVHSAYLAHELAESFPGRTVRHLHLGVPDPLASPMTPAREVRHRHGIPDSAVVFASFGRVTPEKGLHVILTALAQVAPTLPDIRLLVVGESPPYFDLAARARQFGVAPFVVQTGYVRDESLPEYLSAADVCLNLRWPTGRETSAAWVRCLAAGKATVISDLAHQADVPSLDLRSMAVARTGADAEEPVCVHVDLMDEVRMVRMVLRRLTEDETLRLDLGRAARRYWARLGTLELMAHDYEALLEESRTAPPPVRPAHWPAHLTADGSAAARALAAQVGVDWPFDAPAAGAVPHEPPPAGRA